MVRPLRLDFEGALWHVTARGNDRQAIVRDDEDREHFVRVLSSVVSRFGWVLHGWVLMNNHYHLVVETPRPTLSNGMRHLGAVYTQKLNRRWKRSGHLFQGRFFSLHVERESHLLELLRYTALNPVRAGLVATPAEWRWGSYRAAAGLEKRPPWLATEWTVDQFRSRRGRPETAWAKFVSENSDYVPWDVIKSQVVLGSDGFVQELGGWAAEVKATGGIPASQLCLGSVPAEVAARRLSSFLAPEERGVAGQADKALAALVLRDACLETYREIGQRTGLTVWGGRSLVERGRRLAGETPTGRQRYALLLSMVQAAVREKHKTQP